jgi:hypothetical protein
MKELIAQRDAVAGLGVSIYFVAAAVSLRI